MFARSLPTLRSSIARSAASSAIPRAAVSSRTFLTPPARSSSTLSSLWNGRSYAAASPAEGAAAPSASEAEAKVEAEGGAAGATSTAEAKVEDPRIAELEKKVDESSKKEAEMKSSLAYLQADFENLQRRSAEETKKAQVFAIQRFASDLLSTIDILSLALKHVPTPIPAENAALKTLHDGVDMTRTELLRTLGRHGVTQFDPTGDKFDPNLHEALYQVPIEGKEPGTVFETQQLGYMLKERTLRAAQVGVVRAP